VSSSVFGTGVADLDVFVFNGMLADGGARVHAVDVIHAAADGVDFDDAEAHVERFEELVVWCM
jgi:hypothetical protein